MATPLFSDNNPDNLRIALETLQNQNQKLTDQIDSLESDNQHLIEEAKIIKQRFCSDCANKELIAQKQRLNELEKMFLDCKDRLETISSGWNETKAQLIIKEKENDILREECLSLFRELSGEKTTYTEEEFKEFK